ncbi:hypothetical protein TIFTF001_032916 [Ficus carica]|uniref:Uncharacterized protein n=1 Tax=Ficus carica TaxID=3494 RepID=A0AA88J310_FICCA|nr:hypothetical protein TIFTF001_032916 [Ficus carica]
MFKILDSDAPKTDSDDLRFGPKDDLFFDSDISVVADKGVKAAIEFLNADKEKYKEYGEGDEGEAKENEEEKYENDKGEEEEKKPDAAKEKEEEKEDEEAKGEDEERKNEEATNEQEESINDVVVTNFCNKQT